MHQATESQLFREAAADTAELIRSTEPLPLETIELGGGWRDELLQPWLFPVYVLVIVAAIALSAVFPWGFAR